LIYVNVSVTSRYPARQRLADDRDCKVPFSFNGKINKATFAPDKPRLPPEDVKRLEAASRAAQDAN
jgi:hypothetical protein